MQLELGEISEAEFAEIERDVLARIREIKARSRAHSPCPPSDKITGRRGRKLQVRRLKLTDVSSSSAARAASARRPAPPRERSAQPRPAAASSSSPPILRTRSATRSARGCRRGPAHASRGAGRGTLHAAELDAPRAFARWLRAHRHALARHRRARHLARSGRRRRAARALSIPGIDELVGLIEIVRLVARGITTRSSSTPRRPATRCGCSPRPRPSQRWPTCSTRCSASIGSIREQLARVGRPEAADRLIAVLEQDATDARELLRGSHEDAVSLGHARRAARGCRNGGCASCARRNRRDGR